MRSQEAKFLFRAAKEIRVAVVTDGGRVGERLNEQRPLAVMEGEPAFDYCKHMKHLVFQMDSAVDDVAGAEDEHSAQLIRLSRFQRERNTSAGVNYRKLVSARDGLEGLYKGGSFELGSLSGDTPRVPEQLYEQLGQTVKLLRQPVVEPPEPKATGFSVDLDSVATDLESEMPELRTLIDRVDGARKQAEGTLLIKRKALVELRRTILWVGRTAEGLFHLAGEDELADRIRSSTRRPLRPSEQAAAESPESPPEAAGPAGESAA